MLALNQLGGRVCIIGPSNSGKSTLARKLASKLGTEVIHLDQLAHVPNTNWQRRSDQELISEHDKVIASDRWVIDGNYSVCMQQRFQRATSVIWLDPPLIGFLYRYLKRSLLREVQRPGNLEGATGDFNLSLIRYTFVNYPKNRARYGHLLEGRDLPTLRIRSMRGLNSYCSFWGLTGVAP